MRPTIMIAATAAALAGFATAALAHEMDTDQDGLLTLAELQAEYPDLTEATYDAVDANADGAVDDDELAAAWESGILAPLED